MAYTMITEQNAPDFSIGARVRFNYGPMCGEEFGRVTGYQMDRWGARLTAETDAGEFRTIEGFSTIGVGVYLEGEG